jgi:RimJ/RimL family protein N-acetyltransferase
MVVLETPRLTVRRFTPADALFVLRLLNEPSFIRHIGDRGVRTVEQAATYLERGPIASYLHHGFGLYVVELKDGTAIGTCGILKRDELADADIGYSLLPEYWSQGFAHEAAAAVVEYARTALCLDRLAAIVSPENAPSARLLEKLGFSFERMIEFGAEKEPLRLFARSLTAGGR